MTDIQPGTRVYNRAGHVAKYEGFLNGVHFVTPEVIIYDNDGDESQDWGAPTTWPEVFTKAPVAAVAEEMAEINAKLADLKQSLIDLKATNYKATLEHRKIEGQVKAWAKKDKAFRRMLDIIDGKITHFVIEGYGEAKIVMKEECLEIRSEYSNRLSGHKLLTFYGKEDGNYEFWINQYSDGSGSSKTAIPCASFEEATEVLCALYQCMVDSGLKHLQGKQDGREIYWDSARKALLAGAKIPQPLFDAIIARKVESDKRLREQAAVATAKATADEALQDKANSDLIELYQSTKES